MGNVSLKVLERSLTFLFKKGTNPAVNSSPIQDYVHPDDQTQPTYKMICQGN